MVARKIETEWVNPDAPESDVVGGEFLRIGRNGDEE